MKNPILPVIMAGGSGSRLWPLSRQLFPKQFLTLYGNNSMLQETALRLKGINHKAPLVICNEEHRFSVAEQFRVKGIENSGIILEPFGRNTAPAIALAAIEAMKGGDDPLLLVLAADHVIKNTKAFCQTISNAQSSAMLDKLVTFGIVPTAPETGYGYIKRGQESDGAGEGNAFNVEQFVEKPNLATAQQYVDSKEYYWNSGMFMFKASIYLQELKKHQPEIYTACENAMSQTQSDIDFVRIDQTAFEQCPDDSIDYAVMEKTAQAVVVPMDCNWSDVGSWSALWDIQEKDSDGNVAIGDTITIDTKNSYINADNKLVATIGLEDVVVVETKDAVLVADKSKVQQVKQVVEQLKQSNRIESSSHREVYRPWGKFDSVDEAKRFKVKRITVKPGAKLSLQMHHHRAEHWVVVSGTAKVKNGDSELILTENQSTYIPIGAVHSLENPGKVDLELIEVQSGSYLGEDDIVRFEDKYGRA